MVPDTLINLLNADLQANCRELVTRSGTIVPIVEGIPDFIAHHVDTSIGDVYDAKCEGEGTWRAVGYKSSVHYQNTHQAVRHAIGTTPEGVVILDIGCGHGELVKDYAARNTVVGVDLSIRQLVSAKSKGVLSVRADACDLPFIGNAFDIVVLSEVIQHVDDLDKLLAGVRRVTKPGGKVVISTINQESIVRRLYRVYTGNKEKSRTRLRTATSLAHAMRKHDLEQLSLIWIHSPIRKLSQSKQVSALRSAAATNFVLVSELRENESFS